MELQRCRTPFELAELEKFLRSVDLTVTGLSDASVHAWVERDGDGAVVGSTGWEVSGDGCHALIRSVAVSPQRRHAGRGRALAEFALNRAARTGARTAWLFSRRSGGFWQGLGFTPADREQLAEVLAETHQVRMFRRTGQLQNEVAWVRVLQAE